MAYIPRGPLREVSEGSIASTGSGPALTRARWLRTHLAGAAASVLAACGLPAGGEPAGATAQPVTIQWMTDWTGGARGEATKQSIPAFEAQFPRIKLDMQAVQSDRYETFSAHLAAGTLPDVMLFSGNFFEYWAERNVFVDIGPLLRKYRFDKDSVWWEPQYFEYKGKVQSI
jgi:ABC-type glycerol-3-phosphate transport system substrate-binding protein